MNDIVKRTLNVGYKWHLHFVILPEMLATVITSSWSHNQALCSFKREANCIWYAQMRSGMLRVVWPYVWYAQEAYKMDFHLCMVRLILSLITASNIFSILLESQQNIKNCLIYWLSDLLCTQQIRIQKTWCGVEKMGAVELEKRRRWNPITGEKAVRQEWTK